MLKCWKLQGKHPGRICAVSITQSEAAVKQIPLVLDSASTSQILPGRAVNLSKWCKAMPGLGNWGTFPPSIPRAGSTRQSHPRPALLLISKEQPEPREPDEGDIWPWSLCQATAVL